MDTFRRHPMIAVALIAAIMFAATATGCAAAPSQDTQTSPPTSPARPGSSATLLPTSTVTSGAVGPWPKIRLVKVVGGLSSPVGVVSAKDGSGRLFIIEKTGRIKILASGSLVATPFLDIHTIISNGNEQGLLGLAFAPDFATSGRFYVDYTDTAGNTHIARVLVSADPNVADRASLTTVLKINQPYANHNGGQLAFGPDGYLYIGMGDGGSAGDPRLNAQNKASLLGKILRIDVSGSGYTIPPTNPFRGKTGWRGEIWALGVRNPWRFSFDRDTGALWIGDVGQDAWEEVDMAPAGVGGQDYGWSRYEGRHFYKSETVALSRLTWPITEYPHPFGECVTGGFVSRGANDPWLKGIYVFGDYVKGQVFGLRRTSTGWQRATLLQTHLLISSFGEGEAGEIYLVALQGTIYRVRV